MFGLYPKFKPRMAKVFGNAGEVILNGFKQYVPKSHRQFPSRRTTSRMKDEEYDELLANCWITGRMRFPPGIQAVTNNGG
jgi:hypothetical protein